MEINIERLSADVEIPSYGTEGAACFDMSAMTIIAAYKGEIKAEGEKLQRIIQGFHERGYIKIRPHERILFGTGLKMQLPPDHELQIRPRSGNSLKKGIMVCNSPGTIDEDYSGQIGIIILNSNPYLSQVNKGDKIAQGAVKPVYRVKFNEVSKIEVETERGEQGFGDTGN